MDNKIYLLGGDGFVGSSLQSVLKNENHSFIVGDIKFDKNHSSYTDIEDIASFKIDSSISTIINLAAEHRDDVYPVSKYYDVNVKGSENVCVYARQNNINKIIFISSVAIYGFAPKNTDEDGEANYFNEYGKTKYQAEQHYLKWFNEDSENRDLIIIRPTVIFGKNNRGNVYNLLNQIHKKRFIMIGSGKNIKSMAYLENVSHFIKFSLSLEKGLHIFNYIDKPDLDMNQLTQISRKTLFNKDNIGMRLPIFVGYFIGFLADIFAKLLRINLPISSIRVRKFISTTQFDSAVSQTQFKAPYTLKEGLEDTLIHEFKKPI